MKRIVDKEIQGFETEHIEAVRKAAPECTILLKKDGSFPLENPCKIAAFGNGVRKTIKGGTGSGDVNVRHFVSIEEGLKNAGFILTTNQWLDSFDKIYSDAKKEFYNGIKEEAKALGINPMFLVMGRTMLEPEYDIPLTSQEETDTAIYVLARNSGEGADRRSVKGDINLTETEIKNITELNSKYKNFMLVLNIGGLVDLTPVQNVKNILNLGQLGTPTGTVLADILLGKSYPSGKLTMTWTDIESYPSTNGFGDPNDTYYNDGIYVGYRYFDSFNKEVLYPFGYGLGYTDFNVKAEDISLEGTTVSVKAKVTNTGGFSGKETVQVYYSAPQGKLDKPYQELAGYEKSQELSISQNQDVTVTFDVKDMASYDEETSSYILEKGTYYIRVGNSSRSTCIAGAINVASTVTVSKLKNICQGDKVKTELSVKNSAVPFHSYEGEQEQKKTCKVLELDTSLIKTETTEYSTVAAVTQSDTKVNWNQVRSGEKSVKDFANGLNNEELALLCIGAFNPDQRGVNVIGQASDDVAGAAGQTTSLLDKSYNLKPLIMADGPAGLRLSPVYKMVGGIAKPCSSAFGEDMFALMDEETLKAMTPPDPSEEEKNAIEQYQYCVAIPIGTNLAQSFNKKLISDMGDIVGSEMEIFGVHLWLAPALNIYRSPLCGRNFEYYSEDPVVAGLTSASVTEGVQKHEGCATTIKHYACNNQETNRYASNSILSERALREIYLKGFEICVKKAQPHALMTSYNLINGEHSCNSKDLNTYVLRDEWGYNGVVMTDWLVTSSIMQGPNCLHTYGSAAGCVKSGNDITMPGLITDKEDILKALEDKSHPYNLTRAELQSCAERVLQKILSLAK